MIVINSPIIVNHLEPCWLINLVNKSPNLKDKYDTKRLSVSPLKFYSVAEDHKLVIQLAGIFVFYPCL